MTYIGIALALGLVVFLACNRKKTQVIEDKTPKIEETTVAETPEVVEETPPVVDTPDPIVALIATIKKTPCFGKCPVYEIELYSDGKVNYKGKMHVDKMGVWEAKMLAQESLDIVNEITEMGFFDLEKEYPIGGRTITDLPSTITYVNNFSKSLTVTNNHHAPRNLNQIEKLLLEKLETLEFTQVSGEPSK